MYLTLKSITSVFAEPLRLVARNNSNRNWSINGDNFYLSRASNNFPLDLFQRTLDKSTLSGAMINSFDHQGQPKTEDASGTTDHPAISTFAALDAMFRVKKFFESFEAEGKLIKVGQNGDNPKFDFHRQFLDNFKLVKDAVIEIAKESHENFQSLLDQAKQISSQWLDSIRDKGNKCYQF
jgi:hypothetical protein